jgi:flagellar biosynthesis regulator FlaF
MQPRRLEFSDIDSPADIIAPPTPTPVTPVQVPDNSPAPIENYFRFAAARGEFDLNFAAAEWDRQREQIERYSMQISALQTECDRLLSELQSRTLTSNLYSRICDDNRDELNRSQGNLAAALIEIGQIEGKYDRLMVAHTEKCEALETIEVEHRNLIRALSEVSGRLRDIEYANSVLQQANTGQSDELTQLRIANECLSKRLEISHARIGILRADKLALSAAVETLQREDREHDRNVPAPVSCPDNNQVTPMSSRWRRLGDEIPEIEAVEVPGPAPRRKKQVARISTGGRRPRDEILESQVSAAPPSSPATPVLSYDDAYVEVVAEASPLKKARSE